ncbi:conjugal transfer protein [Streptomyces griseoruber]|uniref:conjugal transfer protein n=1 Tax=Streptomyces griseoruber TaxID=1943 RepID=UPI003793198E
MTETRKLTGGQRAVLISATIPMVGFGGLGGWGTFTNVVSEFGPDRQATALGVVAAGEGATLVLALVMMLLTMLGQAAPWPVRAGLWSAPAAAAVTGVVVADTLTESVVYGITPMAMCVAAEGLGLVARRLVVYRTKVDVEAQRRNAQIMRKIAYHRARADRHPWKWVQRWSALVAWRLLRRAGEGDAELGVDLIRVQRVTLTEGAGLALGDMLAVGPAVPALLPAAEPAPVREPAPEPEPEPGPREPELTHEPEPESVPEPEPEHEREPEREQQHGETATPPDPAGHEQRTSGRGSNQDQADREPEREPEPETPADAEQVQILKLADRLRSGQQINGKPITKTTAAPLLGVSLATAQRRLTQARRVVKLAERLKAGDRLTPATAAPLLGVDERTAGRRLNEARQLNGEGQGFYA